tara:strand:+ start:230 stop:682 length:453 start_codon:yes stop_codon:yes gene_type:complete
MKKYIYLLGIILFFLIGCNQNEVIKTHGIAYLDKREKLIIVNKTNKNDTISILGQPSTKGIVDDNLWIYIERTITRGKKLKFGRNYLKKNNTLVIEFDKYGIVKRKEFYNKEKMNKISFAKNETENEIRKENFIHSFLSSVRQKMLTKRK